MRKYFEILVIHGSYTRIKFGYHKMITLKISRYPSSGNNWTVDEVQNVVCVLLLIYMVSPIITSKPYFPIRCGYIFGEKVVRGKVRICEFCHLLPLRLTISCMYMHKKLLSREEIGNCGGGFCFPRNLSDVGWLRGRGEVTSGTCRCTYGLFAERELGFALCRFRLAYGLRRE